MAEKVIVGLSGGVDSSVSALLLLRAGYAVEGLYMRNWDSALNHDLLGNPDLADPVCPQEADYADAEAVARTLGIPLHRRDFIREYWDDVFAAFLAEYRRGRTPNPDILCNRHIKFKAFHTAAKALGADRIAMGHYARTGGTPAAPRLLRGIDADKDQSYFLSGLLPSQLADAVFPVGGLRKPEVRRLAAEAGLTTAAKRDSTGICFIGERRFTQFLQNYLPIRPGLVVTPEGVVLGEHDGIALHTIGQRKGLGLGGSKLFGNTPWYVVGKDRDQNRLIVAQGGDHPLLYADACLVEDVNWITPDLPADGEPLAAKCRYRAADVGVVLRREGAELRVSFSEPVRAVTPGQACVFYRGEECLGGGTIATAFRDGVPRPY